MAKIKLRKIEPVILEFEDGTEKIALFNNEAFSLFKEEFGDVQKILLGESEEEPYKAMAKMLYCGIKTTEPKFTLDEALQLMYMGGAELLLEITKAIIANFNSVSNKETKIKFRKILKERTTPEQMEILEQLDII